MPIRLTSLFPLLCLLTSLTAQPELPPAFRQKLERCGLELLWPADVRYREGYVPREPFEHYDFAMYSAREGLEIRYAIHPWDDSDPATQTPQLLAMRAAATVATNDEAYFITMRPLDQEELDFFRADGGVVYFFRPKEQFSGRKHCRLLVIYREGKGTALVYWLFDDVDNPAIDVRFHALRFVPKED